MRASPDTAVIICDIGDLEQQLRAARELREGYKGQFPVAERVLLLDGIDAFPPAPLLPNRGIRAAVEVWELHGRQNTAAVAVDVFLIAGQL